jgi:hypothetical protein
LADKFWLEVEQYEEKEKMPFMTTPERYGRKQAFAESIETILEARFPTAASQLMSEIRQIHELEQLKRIVRAAATAASADELRELWTAEAHCQQPQ